MDIGKCLKFSAPNSNFFQNRMPKGASDAPSNSLAYRHLKDLSVANRHVSQLILYTQRNHLTNQLMRIRVE